MLSSTSIESLTKAIQTDNIMVITQCPGIGKKTAERLIIELKDKIKPVLTDPSIEPHPSDNQLNSNQNESEDIMLALRQLGYQKEEIKRTFIKHATEISSTDSIEDQIKILLKHL